MSAKWFKTKIEMSKKSISVSKEQEVGLEKCTKPNMKSLFERISVNADELRIVRVKNAVELASDASFAEILKYKQTLLIKMNELEQSLDLGQTSTTDIATNLKNFEPEIWAERIHKSIGDIYERAEIINCRIKIHNILFPNKQIELINSRNYDGIASIIFK